MTTEKEKINFVALGLFKLSLLTAGLVLLLFVLLESVAVHGVKARLFVDQLISGLIQLIDMIAKVLRGSKFE